MKEYCGQEFQKVWNKEPWEFSFNGGRGWMECTPGTKPTFSSELLYRFQYIGDMSKNYVEELKKEPVFDKINRPGHYFVTIDGKELDCRAVQKALGMYEHHCLASAFAYLWRALHKENTISDLEKAVNFLNEEIAYQKEKSK